MLHASAILGREGCGALRAAVDAQASLRNGTTDGMPEFTLHVDQARLEQLLGREAVDALWALPERYRRQATATAVAVAGSGEGAGAPPVSAASPLRAVECFIRKFSPETRPWIKMHADVAAVTVNVALTDEGGDGGSDGAGGRLLGVYDGAVRAIRRAAGDATVHPSSLLHGVSRMRPGDAARYTLILFFDHEIIDEAVGPTAQRGPQT